MGRVKHVEMWNALQNQTVQVCITNNNLASMSL